MVLEPCTQLFPITEPVVRLLHSDLLISIIPVVGRGKFGVVYRHFSYTPNCRLCKRCVVSKINNMWGDVWFIELKYIRAKSCIGKVVGGKVGTHAGSKKARTP